MEYNLKELFDSVFKDLFDVRDVFIEAFSEEHVDLQPYFSLEDFASFLKLNCSAEIKDETVVASGINIELLKTKLPYFKILVYWPTVRVTNENDRYVDIQDLYASVPVTAKGTIPLEFETFTLNRATYTNTQFDSDYMHSHVNSIPKRDFTKFQRPCLGRGPIRRTMVTLKTNNDLLMWRLFCEELSTYVQVESVRGVPYHYLEKMGTEGGVINLLNFSDSVHPLPTLVVFLDDMYVKNCIHNYMGSSYNRDNFFGFCKRFLDDFTKYYILHGHMNIGFSKGAFETDPLNYFSLLDISSCFIKFLNKVSKVMHLTKEIVNALFEVNLLEEVIVKDNNFYRLGTVNHSLNSYIGSPVCVFKGKQITLNIIEDSNNTDNTSTIVYPYIAKLVTNNIINVINYYYGKCSCKCNSSAYKEFLCI